MLAARQLLTLCRHSTCGHLKPARTAARTMARRILAALRTYDRLSRERPIVTKATTGVILFSFGDYCVQSLQPVTAEPVPTAASDASAASRGLVARADDTSGDGGDTRSSLLPASMRVWERYTWRTPPLHEYDFNRTLRQASWGLWLGFWAHSWFQILDRVVRTSGGAAVLAKGLSDMLLYQPVTIALFSTLTGTEEQLQTTGKVDVDALLARLDRVWLPTYKMVWIVWPVVNTINFALVPLHLRVAFLNAVLIPWAMYMSTVMNPSKAEVDAPAGTRAAAAQDMCADR